PIAREGEQVVPIDIARPEETRIAPTVEPKDVGEAAVSETPQSVASPEILKPETKGEPTLKSQAPEGVESRPPESITSARKEMMSGDRAELDLPELPAPERKSWQQSLAEAKPERANILADEVLARPRSLDD